MFFVLLVGYKLPAKCKCDFMICSDTVVVFACLVDNRRSAVEYIMHVDFMVISICANNVVR